METQFPKILVYQDAFSESTAAIDHAFALAEKDNSKITVFDVVPPMPALWDSLESDFEQTQEQLRRVRLREIIAAFQMPSRFEDAQVASGRPAVQIIKKAVERKFALVVKEINSKGTDLFFGSIDLRLIRHCPAPTLLVNPLSPKIDRRILVAVDPGATGSEKILNGNLVYYASSLADLQDSELHFVGAWQSPIYGGATDEGDEDRYEDYRKRIGRQAKVSLNNLVEQSLRKPKQPSDVILTNGTPDDAILEAFNKVKPDLLVLGSVARAGLMGFLLGNTAERVIRQIQCSLLVIKPPKFESPISSRF